MFAARGCRVVSNLNPISFICTRAAFACAALVFNIASAHAAASTCPDGYYTDTHIPTVAMLMPTSGNSCPGYFSLRDLPDGFVMAGGGVLVGATATLCDNGYLSGGTCVPYQQYSCPDGYIRNQFATSTFMQFYLDEGENMVCPAGGFNLRDDVDETVVVTYNGYLLGTATPTCNDGYLANGKTCVKFTQNDCPADYLDVGMSDVTGDTFMPTDMGTCETGMGLYTINQQCDSNTTDNICMVLCPDGELYTDAGTCTTLCAAGLHNVNMRRHDGTVSVFPLYATRTTEHALNVSTADGGVCYINMLPAGAADAMHVGGGLKIRSVDDIMYKTVR